MEGILRAAGDFLVQTGRLDEDQRDEALSGLLQRERESPTAIRHACAIPHYYGSMVAEPIMVFIRLQHPLNLGAPDGVATRFVFLLVGPEQSAAKHLDTLATI
ncbi:MAG: PTS sugar transporter subunit IIA, partial [Pirellulales bacterium]|nr:PTS sugar transporter subunit IIA [Pirellulales bacterium]